MGVPDWQIPGYGEGACAGELDRCYQYYGFQDGECSCHNGATWYSWVCRNAWKYGGCSSNCVQSCAHRHQHPTPFAGSPAWTRSSIAELPVLRLGSVSTGEAGLFPLSVFACSQLSMSK